MAKRTDASSELVNAADALDAELNRFEEASTALRKRADPNFITPYQSSASVIALIATSEGAVASNRSPTGSMPRIAKLTVFVSSRYFT